MMLNINEIILNSGLKKGYIARKANISLSTLTRYCNNETVPNAIMLKKLAIILNTDINEFFLPKTNTDM